MEKIYFSKIQDPEKWPDDVGCYWFPYAEWLMGRSWGIKIVKAYIWVRMLLEKKK